MNPPIPPLLYLMGCRQCEVSRGFKEDRGLIPRKGASGLQVIAVLVSFLPHAVGRALLAETIPSPTTKKIHGEAQKRTDQKDSEEDSAPERPSVTRHSATAGGKTLAYTASAGTMPIRETSRANSKPASFSPHTRQPDKMASRSDPELRGHVTMANYDAGYQMFTHLPSLRKLRGTYRVLQNSLSGRKTVIQPDYAHGAKPC